MRQALDVHRALLSAGVAHEVVRLATPVVDADELPAALSLGAGTAGGDGGVDAACLAVRCCVVEGAGSGPARLVAVLLPSGRQPSLPAVERALGAGPVRPATPDEVTAGTGWRAGLVSPVDLPPDVVLLADAAAGRTTVVYTAVGEPGLALGIRSRDLLVVTGARVGALAAPAGEQAVVDLSGGAGGTPVPAASPTPRRHPST